MTTGTRRVHDFCWINLMTPEASKAKAFFGRLFGWTYGAMPGVAGGHLIEVEGRHAGALMDLAVSSLPPGTPAVIGVMVKVDDADATREKVIALGGRAEPAYDALENGRMAMCSDPNGAGFAIWQPKKEQGADADSHAHGAPSWFETITSDSARAAAFYSALFGWTAEAQPMPGMTYTRFKLGSVPIAGAMPILPHMGNPPPHWGTYFAVDDAAVTARLGVELGATLCVPVTDIPGVGRFAMLQSPQGVPFHVIQYAA